MGAYSRQDKVLQHIGLKYLNNRADGPLSFLMVSGICSSAGMSALRPSRVAHTGLKFLLLRRDVLLVRQTQHTRPELGGSANDHEI